MSPYASIKLSKSFATYRPKDNLAQSICKSVDTRRNSLKFDNRVVHRLEIAGLVQSVLTC